MMVNIEDTDSLFEKSFAKYPFNSKKKLWRQTGLTKTFPFRYIHLFEKAVEVLAFCFSAGYNSM